MTDDAAIDHARNGSWKVWLRFWRFPAIIRQLADRAEKPVLEHMSELERLKNALAESDSANKQSVNAMKKLLDWVHTTHRLGAPADGIRALIQAGRRLVPVLAFLAVAFETQGQGIVRNFFTTNTTAAASAITNSITGKLASNLWEVIRFKSIHTNGVPVSTAATNLDFITGTNTLVLATNSSGKVTIQINSTATGGGGGDAGGTNSRQWGSINLTNWSLIPTGAMASVVSTDFLTNWANSISNLTTSVTNSASVTNWINSRQPASANLTNWSGTATTLWATVTTATFLTNWANAISNRVVSNFVTAAFGSAKVTNGLIADNLSILSAIVTNGLIAGDLSIVEVGGDQKFYSDASQSSFYVLPASVFRFGDPNVNHAILRAETDTLTITHTDSPGPNLIRFFGDGVQFPLTGGASKAAIFDDDESIAAHPTVTSTEVGYLGGVTSGIQGQLNRALTNIVNASTNPAAGIVGLLGPTNNGDVRVKTISAGANITLADNVTNVVITGTGGGGLSTNASQFAANNTLTIAKGALFTNIVNYAQTNMAEATNGVPLTIVGATGQMTNLVEFQNPQGTILASIASNGVISVAGGRLATPGLTFYTSSGGVFGGFYTNSSSISVGVGASEIARFANGFFQPGPVIRLGTSVGNSDLDLRIEAASVLSASNVGESVSNRVHRARTSTTVGEFLESGFDRAHNWFFLRGVTNNSGSTAPTKTVMLGAGTNFHLALFPSNGTPQVAVAAGAYVAGVTPTLAKLGGTIRVNTTAIASAGSAETNLMTYSVPAHTLTNTADRLRFRFAGNFGATANTKQIKVVFGSQTLLNTGAQSVNTGAWTIEGEIIRTGGTAQECSAEFHGAGETLFTTAAVNLLAQTNGIATALTLTSTAAGNGDVTNRTMVVEWHPAP